jgi:RNA 2',3'-cyclic 3'-phosphodiesterase
MRLFVALPLPAETGAELANWMKSCGPQSALRWTLEEQLHITLHFLGEVEEVRLGLVTAALEGLHLHQFNVEFERVEVLGRAGVLAAAAKLTPQLAALEIEVRSRVAALGERRAADHEFHPHITLARARRGAAVPKPRSLLPLPELRFTANCFRLYRSELRQKGAVHTVIREWQLQRHGIDTSQS